jgi:hypothetical protein
LVLLWLLEEGVWELLKGVVLQAGGAVGRGLVGAGVREPKQQQQQQLKKRAMLLLLRMGCRQVVKLVKSLKKQRQASGSSMRGNLLGHSSRCSRRRSSYKAELRLVWSFWMTAVAVPRLCCNSQQRALKQYLGRAAVAT